MPVQRNVRSPAGRLVSADKFHPLPSNRGRVFHFQQQKQEKRMFTVNHRVNGIECLYSAPSVEYIGPLANFGPGGLSLRSADGSNAQKLLQDGEAFVMNEAGATIAKYKLPEAPKRSGIIGDLACAKAG